MAIESGNHIANLNPVNPSGSDTRSQGDDHIRLIKQVLLNTFAGFPGIVIITGVESSGGSANEFIVTVDPTPAEYTDRMMVSFLATHNNAGDSTLRINALPPVSFTANDGAALAADTIKAGSEVLVVFDGTRFRLVATSNVQPLPPDELPSQAGHEGQFLTTNGAAAAWQPLTILRSPQASGYTILQSDLSKLIYWTGSSISFIGIVAASALGAGWYCYIYNAGTAAITIDPTGAETINGQANITLQPSQGALIQCNGSNFVTLDFNRLPSPTGQNGKWLTTDGNAAQWADLPSSSLPPMAGNDGLFLSTDGVTAVWETIPFPPDELPPQLGQDGSFLQTNGTTPVWAQIPAELPSQTGNDGRILSTNGTDPLWIDAPTGGGGGGVEELPPQAGQAGRFLQTNGTDPAWVNVPNELPSMTGQDGAFLSTDGTSPVWSTVPVPSPELPPQAGHATQFLTTNGTDPSWAVVPPTPPELPAQAGQAGKVLTTDGITPAWTAPVSNIKILPIFSPEALLNTPAFGGNTIVRRNVLVNPSGYVYNNFLFNPVSGLYVAAGTVPSNGNFLTSPDGITWTARAITSTASHAWTVAGNTLNMVATHRDGTAVYTRRSTDGGITWVTGGNLPAVGTTGHVVGFGNTFIHIRNATQYNITTNGGTSWTTGNGVATFSNMYALPSGLFWTYISGTNAYTSPTGLDGTWTNRTLPITPITTSPVVGQSPDRQWLTMIATSGPQGAIYETNDGINWVNTGLVHPDPIASGCVVYRIASGLYFTPYISSNSPNNEGIIWMNGKAIYVKRNFTASSTDRYIATDGNGSTWVFAFGNSISTIDETYNGLFY